MHRRAGRITDGESFVGESLIKRLGQDGRLDPSHQTLADDSGESVSTVKRALKAFHACGMLTWARRLVRMGNRVVQTSNGYMLTLGNPPQIPAVRCEVQSGRETRQIDFILPTVSPRDAEEARAALARRRCAVETAQARLLNKGNG